MGAWGQVELTLDSLHGITRQLSRRPFCSDRPTHFSKSPRCSTGLFRTTQLCSEVWHNGKHEWQKPSPLSRRPSYRSHVLAQLSRQRPLRSSFSTLAHVLLPRKGGEST